MALGRRRPQQHCIILPVLFLMVVLTALIASIVPVVITTPPKKPSYSYHHSDFPQTWGVVPHEPTVYMRFENSVHYASDTVIGAMEWNSTLPSGGGLLYLGDDLLPFSISMFHELRCLGIIKTSIHARRAHGVFDEPGPLDRHCMNYVRQMVLCRADLRLEHVRSTNTKTGSTVSDVTHVCRDWSAVYAAAEENYQEYLQRSALLHGEC